MKQGRSINNVAAEIMRQKETKLDFIVSTKVMDMSVFGTFMSFGDHRCGITTLAHSQISQKLNIPKKYYDRMRNDNPGLLSINVNDWFHKEQEKRLVRTLDGDMRAFLSDQYRPLDNSDLMEALLPLLDNTGYDIKSCEITENRLYLKAVNPRIIQEVLVGDVVQSGICISNSEVGLGRIKVEPLIYRLACSNGMVMNQFGLKRNHVGRKSVVDQDVTEFYRDETRRADDKAFWMKAQDTVRATLDQVKFSLIVDAIRDTTKNEITHPIKTVENLSNKFDLSENEQESVLSHLCSGGSLSQYTLANAVTQAAQDVESYDRATDLEIMGGNIIQLRSTDWSVINAA